MAQNIFFAPSHDCRWIARLDQYNFNIVHRPRTQHRNADGLSKRTNDYVRREEILEKLPRTREGFGFLSQKEFDELPTLPYIDKNGHLIPNHPDAPPEIKAAQPLLLIRARREAEEPLAPDDGVP